MINGLFTSASAIIAGQRMQEVTAQNLAHANVPGYRRQFLVQEAQIENVGRGRNNISLGRTDVRELAVDFNSAGTEPTGRPLDVAILGDGFFELEGPQGPIYTRNGSFQVNTQGELVSSTGLRVQGSGGPISIGANTPPGNITIDKAGNVKIAGNARGKIKIVDFADKRSLKPIGSTAFTATTTPSTTSDAQILQGSRELSNVKTVDELVRMIVGMRQYQAAEKTLKAISDAVEKHIDS